MPRGPLTNVPGLFLLINVSGLFSYVAFVLALSICNSTAEERAK